MNKTNTPQLRFKEFKDEWQEKKLGSLFNITSSKRIYQSEWKNSGVPFYRTREILSLINNKKIKSPIHITTELFRDYTSKYGAINKDDMLVTGVGTIGEMYLVKGDHDFYFKDGNVIWLKNNLNYCSKFIFYSFQTRRIQKQIDDNASISTVGTYTIDDAKKTKIIISSKTEQEKIAGFLTVVDEKINHLENKKSLFEKYKKGVMQLIFPPSTHSIGSGQASSGRTKTRFKDENGKDFPDWEEKKFEDLFTSLPTKHYQIYNNEIQSNGKFPVIDQGQKKIAGYSDGSNKLFESIPVIVFGDHTTFLKYIDFKFIVGADGTKILKQKNIKDSLIFLYYYLLNNPIKPEGYKRHFSVLNNIELKIPTPEEQDKIAEFLTSLDNKVELINNQLEQARLFKKSLLQQMFV